MVTGVRMQHQFPGERAAMNDGSFISGAARGVAPFLPGIKSNRGYFARHPPDGPRGVVEQELQSRGALGAGRELAQAADDLECLHHVDRVRQRAPGQRDRRPRLAPVAQG